MSQENPEMGDIFIIHPTRKDRYVVIVISDENVLSNEKLRYLVMDFEENPHAIKVRNDKYFDVNSLKGEVYVGKFPFNELERVILEQAGYKKEV